jgi:hypothetical protein
VKELQHLRLFLDLLTGLRTAGKEGKRYRGRKKRKRQRGRDREERQNIKD